MARRYYAGIGNRHGVPTEVKSCIQHIAGNLAGSGYVLRSGGAEGCDQAFEQGARRAKGKCEIFLPWKQYNDHQSRKFEPSFEAWLIAQRFHPRWSTLSLGAQNMMSRNVHQVLGEDLDAPVEFVLCYTRDGCTSTDTRTKDTGGTGMAISVACAWGIPVFNLKDDDTMLRFITLGEQL